MAAKEKMPEAEVSIHLAHFLITKGLVIGDVRVAIDGAQVQTKNTVHFPLIEFMNALGWKRNVGTSTWQAAYRHEKFTESIVVHSSPGEGDVQATLTDGSTLLVEAKKGTLARSKSSQEYPLMREAIGQLMTLSEIPERALLAIAVPHSEKFAELASRWRKAPLIVRAGIRILTVDVDGNVDGLTL